MTHKTKTQCLSEDDRGQETTGKRRERGRNRKEGDSITGKKHVPELPRTADNAILKKGHFMKYTEWSKKKQQQVSDFLSKYCFFAFNNDQFAEGMERLGLTPEQTDKIVSFRSGGYMLKEHVSEYHELADRIYNEQQQAMKDPDFAFEAIYWELNNHEYSYTGDPRDALDALGLSADEVLNNETLLQAYKKATAQVIEDAA